MTFIEGLPLFAIAAALWWLRPSVSSRTKTNEGPADRIIRVIVGLALLPLLAVGPVPGWGLVGLIGFVPLVTGLAGFCPTYVLLGIDTTSWPIHHKAVGK